jgi:hypothetical protein
VFTVPQRGTNIGRMADPTPSHPDEPCRVVAAAGTPTV